MWKSILESKSTNHNFKLNQFWRHKQFYLPASKHVIINSTLPESTRLPLEVEPNIHIILHSKLISKILNETLKTKQLQYITSFSKQRLVNRTNHTKPSSNYFVKEESEFLSLFSEPHRKIMQETREILPRPRCMQCN